MPTTQVRRLELMRLIYRYKGLLDWELSCLQALEGELVELDLGTPEELVPATKPAPGAGTGPVHAMPSAHGPGNLETNCVGFGSIDGYVELVDAATPYVRALAEPA